ncbi:hypothetical protein [Kitasatospora sp. NPDC086791]|uniref:hypothetical protein n=1 Tax=Kitasatospora sp. NPDC086791 TaxID=3155178 RepID=UPI00341B06A8
MSVHGRPAIAGPAGAPDDPDPDSVSATAPDADPDVDPDLDPDFDPDFDGLDREFADRLGPWGTRPYVIYAPNGNINTGSVHGDQHVENGAGGPAPGGGPQTEAHDGPVSEPEIRAARTGFAPPDCYPEALAALGTRLLFLAGEPGTGRRTTALNLLVECGGNSTGLRALDSDEDLSSWQPTHREARGYLVHGLSPTVRLGPAAIAKLRRRLDDAEACMVVLLPNDVGLLRGLARESDISPVSYRPPSPRAVFDARLEAAVPDERRRRALVDRLGQELDELLAPELVPAQVAELVDTVSRSGDDGPDPADLGQRLSFLAEKEVPDLLRALREDPDALAFLLVTSVLEGLDHRLVRDETDRLLKLADGRLHAVSRPVDQDGDRGRGAPGETPRPNPGFVFRRSLDELLATVRAEYLPGEVREADGYSYTVEPVRFKRHRQAETVLRHVWRQYGEVSGLLTEWMDAVPGNEPELAGPVGRVMGLAAGWSGGRRALRHIHELARSDRAQSRRTAAYALGIAARDEVLAGEVKYRLRSWSVSGGWRLRSTVADACGTDFGASRPALALSLLRRCYRGAEGDEGAVARAVEWALMSLFAGGNQEAVFRHLMEWAGRPGRDGELALSVFPWLLPDPSWFQEQLLTETEFTDAVIAFVRSALNDDGLYGRTSLVLLDWCHRALRDETLRATVERLLTILARTVRTGEFRLFVALAGHGADLVGHDIAVRALEAWKRGEPQPYVPAHASGGLL